LLEEPPQNSFFACFLQGNLHCVHESCTSKQIVGAKPLPNKLLLQMDNYMKDNKNWHLLAFFSLLIARDVFEEMKVGFFVIGHTHKNIAEYFS
jgi:hypothetical protein